MSMHMYVLSQVHETQLKIQKPLKNYFVTNQRNDSIGGSIDSESIREK